MRKKLSSNNSKDSGKNIGPSKDGIVYLYSRTANNMMSDNCRMSLEDILEVIRNIDHKTFKKELLSIPYVQIDSEYYFQSVDIQRLILRINRARSINPNQLYSRAEVDQWIPTNKEYEEGYFNRRDPYSYSISIKSKLLSLIPQTGSGMFIGKDVIDTLKLLKAQQERAQETSWEKLKGKFKELFGFK